MQQIIPKMAFYFRPERGKGQNCSLIRIAAYCIVFSRILW